MNEFLDKLWSMEFGAALIGAVAGGAFSILGAWWQSSVSNKAAALAQAQANAQRGFDALKRLEGHLEAQTFEGMGTGSTRATWNRELRGMIKEAEGPIMLLPDTHKDTRSHALTLLNEIKIWYGLPAWPEYRIEVGLLVAEAVKVLGLFVRGSKTPAKRDMTEVIRQTIDFNKRQDARKELEALNHEAVQSGLSEDGMERARELRDLLGIPHPVSPSPDEPEAAS
ncbi:hypothetical protein F9278_04415 [Streptomyces phaeolivaceus]|uniref:Uncharacterized protein n=1 Tax=Streptomyces phaeolivaceus TaxID=2653200 RepID=A0A5P8JXM8_9ACTN|nr:hypothetical protein [Streptomyces phaeolivaceus]QFQ95554.1 hypothetical protein F9278_04415 [Streptomyces phaeolivaceus]